MRRKVRVVLLVALQYCSKLQSGMFHRSQPSFKNVLITAILGNLWTSQHSVPVTAVLCWKH